MRFIHYRLFIISIVITLVLLAIKYTLHSLGMELVVLGSLHGSVISGVIFVIGFILSATISDYKEAERIPAEIASTIEDMNEDILSIHENYPKFDMVGFQAQLKKVAKALAGDFRSSRNDTAKTQLYALGRLYAEMEASGVPANFIVKLKQQQASLTRHLFRVHYIQKITFIPSSIILAWSIVLIAITLLVFTEIEPFVGGVIITGAIVFILVYVLQLITVIKTPFHSAGKTKDDVSLFLIDRTIGHLESKEK